ncbi:hypothetical protein [Candidatus Hamiltonella defensa]|uniref:hypothetical protein n=1 Tax=Candidatus Williamhamiltonella defendens TaxID=138072 RepID=UPI001581ED87|nr:hypothetical protein [Candidatus Hamiltonella defensa]
MRYKKITIHLLRLSALTILIHSGGGFSETQIFNGGTSQLNESSYLEGIEARNQAQVNNRPGQPLSLSSGGNEKAAVKASGESTVTLEGAEDKKIVVETQEVGRSYGFWAIENSTLTAKQIAITLKGEHDTAVAVQTGAKVDIQNSTLSSIGQKARGIVASEDAKVTGNHLDIRVEGQDARAIRIEGNSTVDIQNSTLSSHGKNAFGILAFARAKVTGNDLDIKVGGQGANAVATNGNATIHLHDSHIQTLATPSRGAVFGNRRHRHDSDHHGRVSPCRR